jgi:hypothetical protein
MGTRSITKFIEEGKEICVLYRQFDGYPEGHGKELAEFLQNMPIVNGYGDDTIKQANGVGCLAAQVVSHFKTKVGGFYLYPPKTHDIGEEFIYSVSGKPGDCEPTIEIKEAGWGEEKDKILIKDKASEVLRRINANEVEL